MRFRKLGNTDIDIPVIGQGTWKFGEDPRKERDEVEALRHGIQNGLTLMDTAEEYGDGGAEKLVGRAIHDIRSEVFLVTKVSAKHCSYQGVLRAAEESLDRLRTDYIDLYLQHWPSPQYEVAETMEAMSELVSRGIIKHVGVSNFTLDLMKEAQYHLGEIPLVCNQLAYHLHDRRIEKEILPFSIENSVTIMGYSPFGYAPSKFGNKGFPQVGSPERKILDTIGDNYGVTAYQVAMNWILRQEGIVAIPKAGSIQHIDDNLRALDWELDEADLAKIERCFPLMD
ncbi:aldo/keto reductase [Paenibacillus sp. ACRSA]|uniref:aldo/keto reductase n=1 Tax=Paenibacillus sp. ACRSA TaxID=2918211 RepID=UPI001EF5A92E|nr:aldo/keto reductase [Paenibacillus sp. ACRSA]MCG7379267.1 aldo/keto reductase [Paenibacillus sp. ACRSA]